MSAIVSDALTVTAEALANAAAYRSAVGAADVAAARATVVRIDQAAPETGGHAILQRPTSTAGSPMGGVFLFEVEVPILVVLPPDDALDDEASLAVAATAVGDIEAQLAAYAGWALRSISHEGPERAGADQGDLAGWLISTITVTLQGAA